LVKAPKIVVCIKIIFDGQLLLGFITFIKAEIMPKYSEGFILIISRISVAG